MGIIRSIALTVLSLSLIVFIALFGRLPIFRRTPIGFCHRVIWVHIPRGFLAIDNRLTGGRIFSCLRGTENYLMNEKHPLVLMFFILLQSISQILFIPAAWPQLSTIHRVLIPLVVIGTYYVLYLAYATPSSITHQNHYAALRHYPYDHTLYHPGVWCRTCQFPKPPRSKHCSICKTCISKMDHHCIWLNNCVGRNNYLHFLSLLVAVSVMLAYGFILGRGILDDHLQTREDLDLTVSQHWSQTDPPMEWPTYSQMWSIALAENLRVGTVTLLAGMSFPLSTCLFIYHVYLIWAGMTTNESDKWADYREDISWGTIWRARRRDLFEDYPLAHPTLEPREDEIDPRWIGDKSGTRDEKAGEGENHGWWIIRLRDRRDIVRRWRPKVLVEDGSSLAENGPIDQQKPPEMEPGDPDERWHRVNTLAELVNIYDLGFLDNIKDVIWNRGD